MLLARLERTLFCAVAWLAQALLVSAAAAGFYQVLSRFVLQAPADWSESWTRAALIWVVFLGVALVQWFTGWVALWAQAWHIETYQAVMLSIAAILALAATAFRLLPASPLLRAQA